MTARDFAAATKLLPHMPAEEFPVWNPTGYYEGCLALAKGDTTAAQISFEKVRPIFEAGVKEHPDSPAYHRAAGMLYTFMGRKEEALREIRRAMELCPPTKNVVLGAALETQLALGYARGGEANRAVALLERLLQTPAAQISVADLRFSWEWDPLRDNPGFQHLLGRVGTGKQPNDRNSSRAHLSGIKHRGSSFSKSEQRQREHLLRQRGAG